MKFISPSKKTKFKVPLFTASIKAGFPSPADDFADNSLDLNDYLIDHPASTFFVRVSGDSMINAGIYDGDLLIVDKAKSAYSGNIVVAIIDGEFTVKRFKKIDEQIWLYPENINYRPTKITTEMNFQVWGVVTFVIHKC